ncbi:MAG: HNH endonuclease [Alphaproteobacteria bacterium]
MKSLPLPNRTDARQHLETAVETYDRGGKTYGYEATAHEIDSVVALYDDYDAALGVASRPLKGEALDENFRAAIHSGYRFTYVGRKLSTIRSNLMHGVEQCPICGISPPSQLDHYLPRSVYEPLSVYVRNLIPICYDCNHSKGDAVANIPSERLLHAYLDELPAGNFLRVVVNLDNGALLTQFEIDPDVVMPDLTRQRLSHQIKRLKLNERYAREINSYMTGHTVALHDAHMADGSNGVRVFLQRQAAVEIHAFHANHWRPVLLEALASHDDFCDGGFEVVLPMPAQAVA